ncbi:MAG TPA: hypothetical protein VMR75_00235 [Candidatus Saccharimonadales bacterium]|nr:hypothetical protein [Candidatus Saccharimonadales bacterium]
MSLVAVVILAGVALVCGGGGAIWIIVDDRRDEGERIINTLAGIVILEFVVTILVAIGCGIAIALH